MGYKVVEPFVVVRDGRAVHYPVVGKVVDLPESEAAGLVLDGKIEPVNAAPPAPTAPPVVMPPPVLDDDEPGDTPDSDSAPVKRRRRRTSEGDED